MADVDMTGQPTEDWLTFRGTADVTDTHAVLHPQEDPNIRMIFDRVDVDIRERSFDKKIDIRVRRGCTMRELQVPDVSPYWDAPPRRSFGGYCKGDGYSECLGGLEYCCDEPHVPVAACTGLWKCPK